MSDRAPAGRIAALCGALAFATSALVISHSPEFDDFIDLKIYMESGGMQVAGLNPYAFDERPEERARLRTDERLHDPWTCETQARWDYYVSSNLPASTLLYAAIDRVSPSPRAYRLTFAALDAVTAGLVVLLVLRCAPAGSRWLLGLLVLGLGPWNPALLKQGALQPEDKGAQVGLMLGACLAASADTAWVRRHLSAVLIGTSISFKLFGVFLLPACLDRVAGPERAPGAVGWDRGLAVRWLLLAAAATLVWFVPYLPDAAGPLLARFAGTSSLGQAPIHASPWRPLAELLGPGAATGARVAFTLGLALAASHALRSRGRAGLPLACLDLLMAYGCAWLVTGALNRYNIVLLVTTCGLLALSWRDGVRLAACYLTYAPLALFAVVNLKRLHLGLPGPWGPTWDPGVVLDSYWVLACLLVYSSVRARLALEGSVVAPEGPAERA